MRNLVEVENAVLKYNPGTNAIELEWTDLYDSETYRAMFTKGMAYLQEFNATGWLSDVRKEGTVSPDDAKWLKEEILPKAIAGGLKRIAAVMEQDVFKKFYVNDITKTANAQSEFMRYFDNLEEARLWMKS